MNAAIQNNRQVALDILKPSRRDLEHGLELHSSALVAESYGLGLHAPINADVFNTAVAAGSTARELIDLAGDMSTTGWAFDPDLKREYMEAWEASGVNCIFQNAGEEGNDPLVLIRRLARHTCLTDAMPDFLQRAVKPADILAAHAAGRRCVYLTCNGVPLAGVGHSVDDELRYLPVFAMLGARMMHLTYNRRNVMADGCGEPGNAGLSDFGHAVIAEMNRLGIIVDLAHTGLRSCWEAARASKRPVLVSHSTVHALHPHLRAKTDEVIRAVVDTGGAMGITNVPAFLGGSGDIAALLDHIDYVAKKFGPESVVIGTDASFTSQAAAASAERMQPLPAGRPRWCGLWPADSPQNRPEWKDPRMKQSMCWTNWPMFTVGLVQRGYDDDAIRGIIGGNLMRVAQAAWEGTALDAATRVASAG